MTDQSCPNAVGSQRSQYIATESVLRGHLRHERVVTNQFPARKNPDTRDLGIKASAFKRPTIVAPMQ
jgi:hypothetical protein